MKSPASHWIAWYGPVPTIGGWFEKNPSASAFWICSIVYSPQMCLGRIGTYACVRSVVGKEVVTTSDSPSQTTLSRPALVR